MCAETLNSESGRKWHQAATIALCFAVALVAIKLFLGKPEPEPEPVTPVVDFAAACPGDRWVGLLNEERSRGDDVYKPGERRACPAPWKPLFTSAENPVPPGLQRFCFYQGADPRRELAILDRQGTVYFDALPEPGRRPFSRVDREELEKHGRDYFTRIDRDCPVVGPAAETLFPAQALGGPTKTRFLQETGSVTLPAGNVRLEIVDSVQDSDAPEEERCKSQTETGDLECSPHGFVLANLARDLLGDAVDIRSKRALRRTYRVQAEGSTPDEETLPLDTAPETGGLFGYWTELGAAIWRAVDAWNGNGRLVLNLSVGWESIYGADVAAVRTPIEVAVCRGALVVAAAGNRRAGPPSLEVPILPAGWETLSAPTPGRCAALLTNPPPYDTSTPYRPLVYAVSGVQGDSQLLSTAKPRATPLRVAFGDHASAVLPADPPSAPDRLLTLTGTSVSALVVSAAAVVRWSQTSDASAFEVMQSLSDAGTLVEPPVDFCLNPEVNCPPGTLTRRIFVAPPSVPVAPIGALPIDADKIDPADVEIVEIDTFENLETCRPRTLAHEGPATPAGNLCPQSLFDVAAQPWVGPQPGSNHNPDCRYSENSPGTLEFEFLPCFRIEGMPVTLDDFTLVAGNVAYRLPIAALTLGDPTVGPCPLEDDPRRVHVVLKGINFQGLHPMYLAVSLDEDNAAVTPLLQVLAQDGP